MRIKEIAIGGKAILPAGTTSCFSRSKRFRIVRLQRKIPMFYRNSAFKLLLK
jgi:hypothetical protein